MKFVKDDGGREAAGFTGKADDCVTRAIAIATGTPYIQVYEGLFAANREFAMGYSKAAKKTKKNPSPRSGVFRDVYEPYLKWMGWIWIPTMRVGKGCQMHLKDFECIDGTFIVSVSRHITAVIDGVIHDTYDPRRPRGRCVYGYYEEID